MTIKKLISVALLLACLSACNTLRPTDDPSSQISADPYQGFNRRVHNFNTVTDNIILKPLAKGYKTVAPKMVRKSVSNFFGNLWEPLYAINNLLQGKVDRTLISTYRFVVNSTFGIGGLFDVVDYAYDVKPAREDLGQTLAAWGVKTGPYLVLPFFGPSNFRDGFGLITERITYFPNSVLADSGSVVTGLTVLRIIDNRSQLLGLDGVIAEQLDVYQFLKVASEEARLDQLYDGNPPLLEEADFDDF